MSTAWLVANVVTGKLDVCAAAAKLPAESEGKESGPEDELDEPNQKQQVWKCKLYEMRKSRYFVNANDETEAR